MVAAAGGLDALVFTGGIGEHHPRVRAAVVERLGWPGLTLDGDRNAASGGEDRDVASDHSAVRVLVVAAREELVAAEHAARALARA